MKEVLRELRATGRPSDRPKAEILRCAQNDRMGSHHDKMELFLSKQVRLDSIPPSGGSGMDASKKLELPPNKRDELKAPSKKSGSTIKKEKPKQTPAKIKGAELWRDCPVEFLSYAKEGMVSARVTIPGPGFILKEAGLPGGLFITEAPEVSEKIDSTPQSSSNTRTKSKPTFSKPKGKSK